MGENQFAMVSDWMGNGNINDFVKAHPDANRPGPVRSSWSQPLVYSRSHGLFSWRMLLGA